MDYSQFIKKIQLPVGFKVPTQLAYEDLIAKPLTRADIKPDLEAVNSSVEIIRKTRGGSWPEGQLSEDYDFLDLVWHEREFREGKSFAYVIYDTGGKYRGCFYIYPLGFTTELSETLRDKDVDVSWWVTAEAYEQGYYEKLYVALKQWLSKDFPFRNVYYSNREIPPG